MTPLRQRMVDAMVTRGFAARTQESYVEAISRLARHYHRSPTLLSKDEVSAYLLDMVSTRHLSYSPIRLVRQLHRLGGRTTEGASLILSWRFGCAFHQLLGVKREVGDIAKQLFRRSPRCCKPDDSAHKPLCKTREGAEKEEGEPEYRPEKSKHHPLG